MALQPALADMASNAWLLSFSCISRNGNVGGVVYPNTYRKNSPENPAITNNVVLA